MVRPRQASRVAEPPIPPSHPNMARAFGAPLQANGSNGSKNVQYNCYSHFRGSLAVSVLVFLFLGLRERLACHAVALIGSAEKGVSTPARAHNKKRQGYCWVQIANNGVSPPGNCGTARWIPHSYPVRLSVNPIVPIYYGPSAG